MESKQVLALLISDLTEKLEAANSNPPAMLFLRGELLATVIDYLNNHKQMLKLIHGNCAFCRLVLIEKRSPNCVGCVQHGKKFWEAPWGN